MRKIIDWGTMVRATEQAVKNGVLKSTDIGIVLGHYNGYLLRVVKFGQVTVRTYAPEFWEPMEVH